MGLGMSSIYATSLLWCERYIALTNSVTALFTLFGMAAANVLQGTFHIGLVQKRFDPPRV